MKRTRDEEESAENPEAVVPGPQPSAPEAEGDALAALERERDEYLASWKRAAADYQNLRRRLSSDVDAAVARGKSGLLSELLLVLDYLDMALATPVETAEGKSLHAGVEATRDALLAALDRQGVKPLPEGGTFDPAVHACVEKEVAEGREAGEILATLRKGYTMQGKVLRHAQVRVAAGHEKPETD